MTSYLYLSVTLLVIFLGIVDSFTIAASRIGLRQAVNIGGTRICRAYGMSMSADADSSRDIESSVRRGPATFDERTKWQMKMFLSGKPVDGVFSSAEVQVSAMIQFREDEGFEPPQGPIVVLDKADNKFVGDDMSFWKLDEDPSKEGFDKAGFWIWGLFEEPQYPFLTFDIEIKQEIPLAEGSIPAGKLYGQAKITRSKDKGVSLSDGVLTCRKPYKIAVDLLGLSDGILQEIQPCGTFTLTPS